MSAPTASRVLAAALSPAVQGAGPDPAGEATGAPGSAVPASPAGYVCDHADPEKRRACLADHYRLMARLADPRLTYA